MPHTLPAPADMPVVIFCGGRGTRLKEETEVVPKPLVRIGEKPILWHIMKTYYTQGFRRFVLLLGYKGEKIKDYFYRYQINHSNFTIRPQSAAHEIVYHSRPVEDWEITFIDTGEDSQTGARLKRAEWFLGSSPFMLTYGDGVSDVNLGELMALHKQKGFLVTVTGIHPPGRFGEIVVEGNEARSFWEKPQVQSGNINGGFFVVDPGIFKYLNDDSNLNFEKEILPKIAREGQLAVHTHTGYWQCMDTLRDMEFLNDEWRKPRAPWKIWD